jgi:proteasome lid subunit RPN8/RPN11
VTVHPDAPKGLKMGPGVWQDMTIAGEDWSSGLERCGIIFGVKDAEGTGWVAGCAELLNVAADPVHNYAFEESAQAKAWSRVERWGYEVLGIWHTHPSGPEGPSQTDLDYAQPWYCYPVLWPAGEEGAEVGMGVCVLDTEVLPQGYAVIPHEVVVDAGETAQRVGAEKTLAAAQARVAG